MIRPNFLIIGAAKSGTTSLYKYLSQHPDVFMSRVKEPHYFSYGEAAVCGQVRDHLPHVQCFQNEYLKLFKNAGSVKAVGEASTSYLENERARRRIRSFLPEVKLIAILRDPSARAHSHFMHNKKRFSEQAPSLEKAIELEPQRLVEHQDHRFNYLNKGFYYQYISAYIETYSQSRVKVFLFEDLVENAMGVVKECFQFLEVDDQFEPDVRVRYNVSGTWRNRGVEWVFKHLHPLRCKLETTLPPRFVSKVGELVMTPESPDSRYRQELIGVYKEDILRLQDLLGRDLSTWLR